MQVLSRDDSIILLIQLMFFIEELLRDKISDSHRGRPSHLSNLEIVTILVFDSLVERHQTLRGIYDYITREYGDCFRLPNYQNFVARARKLLPVLKSLLKKLLINPTLAFADSTLLAVCRLVRSSSYRTLTRKSVGFTKNLMGWFFGFKLHLAVDETGSLVGFHISKGNHHDRRHAGKLIKRLTKTLIGDSHYGGKPLVAELASQGVTVISNANTKEASLSETRLLGKRNLVESVFAVLKGQYGLVSSYARSRAGYLLHYVRILLGYQVGKVLTSGK